MSYHKEPKIYKWRPIIPRTPRLQGLSKPDWSYLPNREKGHRRCADRARRIAELQSKLAALESQGFGVKR